MNVWSSFCAGGFTQLPPKIICVGGTIGLALFAECRIHSAKVLLHSAKSLPSVALGKEFAECGTRQTALGKKNDGEGTLAECLFSGTRQKN